MILNFSKNKTIATSGMPNMATTLNGWETEITLIKLLQRIVGGELVTDPINITFKGVWQPLKMEQLQLKPENERSWEWVWLHVQSGGYNLETADKVIFNGKRFKVTEKKDYSLNGYVEYQLCRDYEQAD